MRKFYDEITRVAGSVVTVTANGVSHITSGVYAPYVRANFVSEAGGTDATVDFDWYGAR